MNSVFARAEKLLGKTNHNGEWRVSGKDIREDFTMDIWTFGYKIVYAVTLENSE